MFTRLCTGLALLCALLTAATGTALAGTPDLVAQGRRIYTEGVLVSGQPLQASRASGASLSGSQAACTACHRASGMGSVEGALRIAPISQRYLFAQADDLVMANMDGRRGKQLNPAHAAYTDTDLATALRQGISNSGRVLGELMPRYELQAQDLAALSAYLHQLSAQYSPGVSRETIRFASVITPDVPQARRAVFKAMLDAALVAKNSSTSPRKRYMTTAATFATQTERRWEVQVWELTGAPETWNAQLQEHYRAWPVFALLSGLSDSSWAPVDAFCQTQQVPCWFPSALLPSDSPSPYGLYFSRGVLLEAAVLAQQLADAAPGRAAARVLQVHGSAGGTAAAKSLSKLLLANGRSASDFALGADAQQARIGLRAALQAARPGDALVLWLDATQLQWLNGSQPPTGVTVWLSGSLLQAAGDKSVPAAWKPAVRIVYPYALPQQRQANLAYLHAWLQLRSIALLDEALQSELFFSLNLMTDTLQDMLDNLYRDYLIERTEDMLGRRESSKAEQESRDRQSLGRSALASVRAESVNGSLVSQATNAQAAQQRAFALGDSEGTTVYPHLSLGPTQRFASRGAYILHFADGKDDSLEALSDWIVP